MLTQATDQTPVEDCLTRAQAGVCTLGVNPAGASTPYTLAVPAGLSSVTVLISGGRGANGDGGATGGRAGLTVAQVPLAPGGTVQVFVATGASSTTAGVGWRDGGEGIAARGPESDSGGGGGASAVVTAGGDPLVVAGGGGGAGGTFNAPGKGGNGGEAGLPARAGTGGIGPNSTKPGTTTTFPGGGGCANGDSCGSGNSGSDGNGGVSYDVPSQESGGGGGGGWPNGGGSGGTAAPNPFNPLEFAGGGGGAGGQNYVTPTGTTLASGSTTGQDGSVTILPAGSASVFSCGGSQTWTAPSGTRSVIGVAIGGTGGATSNPSNSGAPGAGALAVGVLPTTAGQQLTVTPGCGGYGQDSSPGLGRSGGGGHAPADNADDGGGGGGGSTISTGGGTPLLTAGGGGGSGGYAETYLVSPPKIAPGGAGGTAGLGWGRGGAGIGGGAGGVFGGGGPSAQTNGNGDQGSGASDIPASGGGGGGGGGLPRGGQGGNTSDGSGGGGGTAGQSSYNPLVFQPRIGTTSGTTDGRVVLLALPVAVGSGYDNDGIGTGSPVGFDGVGDQLDPTALAGQGIRPGGLVGVGPVVVTWPDVAPGANDNYLANGRTLSLSGTGSTLAVLGASTFGGSSGTATITYTDGSTSQFTLALPDWGGGSAPGTFSVINVDQGVNTYTVYGQLTALTPGKQAASLTLPNISSSVGSGITAMHVFAVGVGGPNNQGISTATGNSNDGFGYFDGNGDAYAPTSLAANGYTPGAQLTVLGAPTTWPSYAPGIADNYVAQGQSVGLFGSGQRLVITGAASFGGTTGVSGVATITYQDGTTSSFTLGFADWIAGSPLPGQTTLTTVDSNQGGGGLRVFATSTPLDPSKTVVAISLPDGPPANVGDAALHVFTLSLAPPTSAGADLGASLSVGPADVSATAVTGSAVPAGTPLRVAVRVDHLGGTDSGPYGLAVLLPPGAEPTDLGGGQRLGPFVVFTGADLHPGGSDTRTLTITAPPPGISVITAATAAATPDPTLRNNVAFHVLLAR